MLFPVFVPVAIVFVFPRGFAAQCREIFVEIFVTLLLLCLLLLLVVSLVTVIVASVVSVVALVPWCVFVVVKAAVVAHLTVCFPRSLLYFLYKTTKQLQIF